MDMRLYWVCNRVKQGKYLVHWARGKDNLANYFTKHHPTKHHCATLGTYLVPTADSIKHACYQLPGYLLGCVKSPPDKETVNGRTRYPPPKNRGRTDGDVQATRFRRRIHKWFNPYVNLYSNS